MKVVRIEISNIETWLIPLEFIAKHRADYYKSKSEKDDFNYEDEVKFIMKDDFEGIDWLQNNMDYDDFVNVLKVIRGTDLRDIDWMNSDSMIMIILFVICKKLFKRNDELKDKELENGNEN